MLPCRFSDAFLEGILRESSSSEISYISSNSVPSVQVLARFHGLDELEGELLSSIEAVDGDSGNIGADRK